MNMEFLEINKYPSIDRAYLKHFKDVHSVQLPMGSDYDDMFGVLQAYFKPNPEKHTAVNEWVDMNKMHCEDHEAYGEVINPTHKSFIMVHFYTPSGEDRAPRKASHKQIVN